MVFSCLEVILNGRAANNKANWQYDVKKIQGEKTSSATSAAVIYLLVVADICDMKASTEETCENETTELLW